MQAPSRDRRGPALLALCLAFVICVLPAGALEAEYWIAENASAYHADYTLTNASGYTWWDLGLLGERIPLTVSAVTLRSVNGTCDPCPFTAKPPNEVTFDRGDYVLSFDGTIHNNQLLVDFETPSSIRVHVPKGLDVRNPLLGVVSPEGNVTEELAGILISWNNTRMIECRMYDPFRETLLTSFLTFWAVAAVVLLFPFLAMRRKKG
ncbi:MAG: DUF5803 family protein [Methanomicrobiales archaeon]|nr:DUF5803 family protein [Methanomicrobiales archaeon]